MSGGLVFGLETTRVWDLFYVYLRLCVSCDAEVGRWCSEKLYYLNVTFLNSNKAHRLKL
jgi:hypothetical protein